MNTLPKSIQNIWLAVMSAMTFAQTTLHFLWQHMIDTDGDLVVMIGLVWIIIISCVGLSLLSRLKK